MTLCAGIGVYGFPKSGNTWVEGMFAALGRNCQPGYKQSDIHITRRSKSSFSVHPLIRVDSKPCIVFKSHERFQNDDKFLADAESLGLSHIHKAILVKRNPLDVLLSFLNYAVWSSNRKIEVGEPVSGRIYSYFTETLKLTEQEFAKLCKGGDVLENLKSFGACDRALEIYANGCFDLPPFRDLYGTWVEHTLSWEKQDKYELLVVRYEDLIRELPVQAGRLAKYIDVPVSKVEQAFGKREKVTQSITKNDAEQKKVSFYNKLSAGYFWDYFSVDMIERVVENRARFLAETGYADLIELFPKPNWL